MAKVVVFIGSMSDAEKMKPCIDTLKEAGVNYDVHCISAHRAPDVLRDTVAKECSSLSDLVQKTSRDGTLVTATTHAEKCGVIIAAAGMAAALPGVIASHTTIPVIGVPLSGSALNGQDALYSIAQMPPGIPVATVAINGAKNAAILAMQIISTSTPGIAKKLDTQRAELRNQALHADREASSFYDN